MNTEQIKRYKDYKKSNKVRRKYLLDKTGFKTEQEYFTYLGFVLDTMKVIKASRTFITTLLKEGIDETLTVNFNKKSTVDKKIVKEILDLKVGKRKLKFIDVDITNALKKLLTGEERTMTGVHYGKTINGRLLFTEVIRKDKKPIQTQLRQVDLRTVNWFIHKNIKYQVK